MHFPMRLIESKEYKSGVSTMCYGLFEIVSRDILRKEVRERFMKYEVKIKETLSIDDRFHDYAFKTKYGKKSPEQDREEYEEKCRLRGEFIEKKENVLNDIGADIGDVTYKYGINPHFFIFGENHPLEIQYSMLLSHPLHRL